jgi:hypothetical protein
MNCFRHSRFEVFTAEMWIVVFWVVTPCGRAADYQRFGGKYRLHVQDEIA